MSGRPVFDRDTYAEDIAALRGRGLTWSEVAIDLGMSRATLYRIRGEQQR